MIHYSVPDHYGIIHVNYEDRSLGSFIKRYDNTYTYLPSKYSEDYDEAILLVLLTKLKALNASYYAYASTILGD